MLCEKFGDYCLDLSKLIFGGVILAAIMQLDINTVWLFVVGTVIVALVGIIWCTRDLRYDASNRLSPLVAAIVVFVRLCNSKPTISGISGETFWLYLIRVV